MKKLIFVLIMIITLTNVSFASFPVTMEYVISIDTIPDTNKIVIKETTAEFHSRLEKEGFDIDNCMCEDCRRFKNSDIKESERRRKEIKIFGTLVVVALILLLVSILVTAITESFSPFYR